MNNGETVILFLVVIVVGIALIVLLPGGCFHLPQLVFWPFSRRREEALRMRLLRDKIASRRTWRGDLERRLTAVERTLAEEASAASRLSVGERRALHRLTDAEVEEALHIPRTPSSLKAPSSAATTPPAGPQSTGRISSASSGVKVDGR